MSLSLAFADLTVSVQGFMFTMVRDLTLQGNEAHLDGVLQCDWSDKKQRILWAITMFLRFHILVEIDNTSFFQYFNIIQNI